MTWWQPLLGLVLGLAVSYAVLVVALLVSARRHPETLSLRAVLRLLPDLLRLVRSLLADKTVPRGVRVRLVLLLAYLASPIDLVPDVVPVLGYADDVLVVALVLRAVVRRAGADALRAHWDGTPDGLAAVERLAGLRTDLPDSRT
ncbi:MAG TPA: YkvA family protein [Actinomycetales bacterium]|nr:YkvA family protein [Actinomycetales bacterium]